jgi:cytochrome c peroxidase
MPIEDPNEMDLPVAIAAARAGLTPQALSHALAAYVRSILAGDSRFDRFVNGDRAALSRQERSGLELFRGKANCTACHVGPTLSDHALHNTGVAWKNDGLTDAGGGNGKFKTPTLREIARTAPYMHNGSLATLQDVIDHYDHGGNRHALLDPEIRPLHLTAAEKQQLRAFLEGLSGSIWEGSRLNP